MQELKEQHLQGQPGLGGPFQLLFTGSRTLKRLCRCTAGRRRARLLQFVPLGVRHLRQPPGLGVQAGQQQVPGVLHQVLVEALEVMPLVIKVVDEHQEGRAVPVDDGRQRRQEGIAVRDPEDPGDLRGA